MAKGAVARLLPLVLAFLVLTGCTGKEKNTYFKGDKALARGDFQVAYSTFQKVASRGGHSRWVAMAVIKMAQMERMIYHRPQKALEYCERVAQGPFPREYRREALLLKAHILADDLNRPLEGLKVLEGMGDAPGNGERERLMVEYAIRAGRLEEAARLARGFIQKGEGEENLRFTLVLADLFKGAGDYKDAEELYNRVISQGKGDLSWEATLGLAGLREDQGRLREALKLLKVLRKEGYKTSLVEVKMRHIRRRLREERG